MRYSKITEIIAEAKKGRMFILVDDENRENEGDLTIPASKITPSSINFMAKHGRGLICLTLCQRQADKLNLSLMSPNNISRSQTAFTVSIDAKTGVTTGISAHDRFRTIKKAIQKNVSPKRFVSPGHVFPIVAKNGGVLVRAGHTEASVDISRFAKCGSYAVICEIMNDDGTMAKGNKLLSFAKYHKLKVGKIDDLIEYRLNCENFTKLKKTSNIKIDKQIYTIKIFENSLDGSENFALIKGDIKKNKKALKIKPSLAYVHRHLSIVTKYKKKNPHIKEMKKTISNLKTSDNGKMHVAFGLGKAFEDIKDYENAFFHYNKVNS